MTMMRRERARPPRGGAGAASSWLLWLVVVAVGFGVYGWGRGKGWWAGGPPHTVTVGSYTSAELWAMTDEARMRVLGAKPGEVSEPLPLFIDEELVLCHSYSLPDDEGWTWIRGLMKFPEHQRAKSWHAITERRRPGPGLAILYFPSAGGGGKTYVLGTVTFLVREPVSGGGWQDKKVTVHDDAMSRGKPMGLNPASGGGK